MLERPTSPNHGDAMSHAASERAFLPHSRLFFRPLFITPHLKPSQLERREGEEELLFLCARACERLLLVKEKCVDDNASPLLCGVSASQSRHNLFLCCCCCRYRGGVQDFFLFFLSFSLFLFAHISRVSHVLRAMGSQRSLPDPLDRLQQVCCSGSGGVIMVTLSADSACGENRYSPHFVFREARACPICLYLCPLYENVPRS